LETGGINMLNQFDRFSENAKLALVNAQELARSDGSIVVDTDHLLLGLLLVQKSAAADLLSSLGVNYDKAKTVVDGGSQKTGMVRIGGLSEDTQRILELAIGTASQFDSPYVGTEHVLYGITLLPNSKAALSLIRTEADLNNIRAELEGYFSNPSESMGGDLPPEMMFSGANTKRPDRNSKTPILDSFATDLTKMAKDDRLDPVVGREKEIARVVNLKSSNKK
jgi:ATP-dependent Clp protease ATP-binding subunit ClpC